MELEKCVDADQSIEMQTALKRFEVVCHSLDDEHTKLLALEERRQKLNEDLERLRNEIKEEKNYFRSVIDKRFTSELESNDQSYENEQLSELVEPLSLDTGAISEFIANQRDVLALYENGEVTNRMQCDYSETKSGATSEKASKSDEISMDIDALTD